MSGWCIPTGIRTVFWIIFNHIFFYFIKADGSAYEMRMNVEREAFSDFQMIDNYEEYVENLNKIGVSNAAQNRKGKLVYKDMEL